MNKLDVVGRGNGRDFSKDCEKVEFVVYRFRGWYVFVGLVRRKELFWKKLGFRVLLGGLIE